MEEEMRRLKKWAKGEPQPPVGIELAPTLRCNFSCKFCWRRKEDFEKSDEEMKVREMSLKRYIELLEEAGEMGVQEVKVIGGGEPLFRDETFEIMKEIKRNGMRGYICTNGSLFTEDMIKELAKIGWDHVKMSIHGTKETHNEMVEAEAFEKTIENLGALAESSVETEIGMVVVNENYEEIEKLLTIAEDIGVDHFFLEPITVYSKMGEKLELNEEEREELKEDLRRLQTLAEEKDINTNFQEFVDNNLVESTNRMKEFILSKIDEESDSFAEIPCYEPFLRMGIRVDGRVAPCGFYDEEKGDSVRNKDLEEVWFGEYFEERRKEQKEKKLPDYCSKCCTTLVNRQRRLGKNLEEIL
ncbi:MAG: radical SAM/SPASM domain-containing protein [Candidatus Aenigmatarchaeota archaeon]